MFNPKLINVMDINNKILEALSKIPNLVVLVERLLAEFKIKFDILAKAAQNKAQAEIPPEAIDAVTTAVTESVRRTPCASPNLSQVSAEIAKKVYEEIRDTVYDNVRAAASLAIQNTPMTQNVAFAPSWEVAKYAEEKTRRKNHVLTILCVVLGIALGLCTWYIFGNEAHLGQQYVKIHDSKYTTDAEREMLRKNTVPVSFLPGEYENTPRLVRQKIRRNKEILRQRQAEAKANDGDYTTSIPLER